MNTIIVPYQHYRPIQQRQLIPLTSLIIEWTTPPIDKVQVRSHTSRSLTGPSIDKAQPSPASLPRLLLAAQIYTAIEQAHCLHYKSLMPPTFNPTIPQSVEMRIATRILSNLPVSLRAAWTTNQLRPTGDGIKVAWAQRHRIASAFSLHNYYCISREPESHQRSHLATGMTWKMNTQAGSRTRMIQSGGPNLLWCTFRTFSFINRCLRLVV